MSETPITDMITEMLKNCIPNEMIILAVRSTELALSTRKPVDETAEKRRAWDREYRRRKRGIPPDPPDTHPKTPDVGSVSLSSLEDKKGYPEDIKKEKKARGTKIPPDWIPKQSHYDEGASRGLSRARVDDLASNMRTWCAANANRSVTTKADWDATFTGFIRREPHGQRTGANRAAHAAGPAQTGADSILTGMGRLASRIAERQLAERQHGLDVAAGDDPKRN